MQSLNILSLTDNGLEALASKIPQMKHVSISSINNQLRELRSFTPNLWSLMKVQMFSTMGTPIAVIIILLISDTSYFLFE